MEAQQEKLTIAIEGCCHGELDNIYGTLQYLEKAEGKKIDLLICCGDFQATRNLDDLECMACPAKYRQLMTFYKYYSGASVAPYPTLFIGGNHEATNYMWELYYGGWAAPQIFFMGYSGVVQFGGYRIAGLTGIYTDAHYRLGHFEQPPYNPSELKSAYHVRELETYRLSQLQQHVDIFLSHDWPRNVINFGDREGLLRRKSFLRSEVDNGSFGSRAGEVLMEVLQPDYWFAAHMHTKFPAVVQHASGATTRFLALDKCLPGRDFLQVLELPLKGPKEFHYDAEWLATLRTTHNLLSLDRRAPTLPAFGHLRAGPKKEDLEHVQQVLSQRGTQVPNNFQMTAPAHDPHRKGNRGQMPRTAIRNPQTVAFLEMLGLEYNLEGSRPGGWGGGGNGRFVQGGGAAGAPVAPAANPEEIDLGDEEDLDADAVDEGDADEDPMFRKMQLPQPSAS